MFLLPGVQNLSEGSAISECSNGGGMISASCNIREFVEAVKSKEISEMIVLADMEALRAWRMSRRHKKRSDSAELSCNCYESLLREFVRYARSGVFPKKASDHGR
jgi:hypothetical protein